MKIKEIRLTNFKRFTDTTITDIPPEARLVFLAGPNGCGKSSLIDAVHMWHRHRWVGSSNWDEAYHLKQIPGATGDWSKLATVIFHDPQPSSDDQRRKAVYVRSAYRNDPEFVLNTLSRIGPAVRENRIMRLIDNDQAVSVNYRRLVSQGMEEVYERADPKLTIEEFRERSIGEIRDAMQRLFPGLLLLGLGSPLAEGTFRFDKGESKSFLYKNLSGGEKAAFDILLDVLVKKMEFDDTVFFIDEPDAHLSPSLQSAFLEELLKAIPENSQLWLATHSIGLMRQAVDMAKSELGSVLFLDFEGQNFDLPVMMRPIEPSRPFWKRALQIALDDLATCLAPETVILCEGDGLHTGKDFDANCYNSIFESQYPRVLFVGAGNAHDVQNDPQKITNLLTALAPGVRVIRVIDRDDRSDREIADLQTQGVRVLSLRTIESYLLHDSVLEALCSDLGQPQLADPLLAAKESAIRNSVNGGGASDDMKRAAGDIYNAAKRFFPDRKLGNDKRAFMKEFCAPRVRTGMPIYEKLRRDIFGD